MSESWWFKKSANYFHLFARQFAIVAIVVALAANIDRYAQHRIKPHARVHPVCTKRWCSAA